MVRCRRRHVGNLVLRQILAAGCALAGCFILLLVIGTQVLDWPWAVGLPLAAIAAVSVRIWRRLPSDFTLARMVDARLALQDTLATAVYFHGHSDPLCQAQYEQAERVAAGVDARRAIPLATPRSVYALFALMALASGLMVVRYGISRHLDLRPNLAGMLLDALRSPEQAQQARLRSPEKPPRREQKQDHSSQDPARSKTAQPNADPVSAPDEQETARQQQQIGQDSSMSVENRTEQNERASSKQSSQQAGQPNQPMAMDGDPSERSQQGGSENAQKGRQSNEDNSLLSRFRDAMANLMSRLKSSPRGAQSQQMASNQPNSQAGGMQAPSQKGQMDPNGQGQSQGAEQPASSDQEGAKQSQGGSGDQSGKSGQRQQNGHNGIGKEDGSKDVKQAEQLAAMGKISEIIGKRSAALTGQMTVETSSGDQRLKTAYSQQSAQHAESGGEIHRDEIPLAYQRYVQQYFEEVRKTRKRSAQ